MNQQKHVTIWTIICNGKLVALCQPTFHPNHENQDARPEARKIKTDILVYVYNPNANKEKNKGRGESKGTTFTQILRRNVSKIESIINA